MSGSITSHAQGEPTSAQPAGNFFPTSVISAGRRRVATSSGEGVRREDRVGEDQGLSLVPKDQVFEPVRPGDRAVLRPRAADRSRRPARGCWPARSGRRRPGPGGDRAAGRRPHRPPGHRFGDFARKSAGPAHHRIEAIPGGGRSRIGGDPLLAPLGGVGGPTGIMALLTDSWSASKKRPPGVSP
jgi:hypothetical protein